MTTEWLDTLKELQTCLEEEQLDEALEHCQELLQQDGLDASITLLVQQVRLKCMLHLGNFQEVISDAEEFKSLHAYALYRLQRYQQAKNLAKEEEEDDELAKHVLAQSLYRLHESPLELYQRLLTTPVAHDEDERIQVQTNALAAAMASATPYVTDTTLDICSSETPSYDFLYNLATYNLLTGSSSSQQARALLQEALAVGQETLDDDMMESELALELAPIHVQLLEWSLAFHGLPPTKELKDNAVPPAVRDVVQVNRATQASSLAPLPKHWTALQQRLYHDKRALLQFRQGHYAECLKTCQLLLDSLVGKNRHIPPIATDDKASLAWWRVRIHILQAHVQMAQSKTDVALQVLKKDLEQLETMKSCKIVDHAIANVKLHLHHFSGGTPQEAVQVLQDLPESIQSQKAVAATLISLYQDLGQEEQATKLVQEHGMADYLLAQKKYQEAADCLEQDADNSPTQKAKLVLALSHADPERCQSVWESLSIEGDDDDDELDGNELEERDLPRIKSKKTAISIPQTTQKTKSHEAVMRRRARKRQEYLDSHPEQNKKPDPERWLPKHERSYYRRRGRNKGGHHQGGGVSEKDAAKLDVAARKSTAADAGPSTAQMKVASASKRGKRR